jgi:ketosteroid isomerase-like protein
MDNIEKYRLPPLMQAWHLHIHAIAASPTKQHTRTLGTDSDMKGWSELCAGNVVAEFPFAPQGSPRRLEGREALYEYLRNYPAVIDDHRAHSTHRAHR